MKSILKGILRFIFWLLLAALAAGGLYALCAYFNIPKSAAAAGAAIVFALVLGIVIARRIVLRRRRRMQIERIVSLDSTGISDAPADSRVIENRWSRAVSIMRESYLGRWGNPLYALPWYMIMGKSGAGKSSSISHSGLSAMKTDVGPEEPGASTRNCDWHFFREAIIMDTAGRYAMPINEAQDSAEWREFLTRLARYRRREPLNGLVLAVPADSLYGRGEHLLPEARCLRGRIDEIMRILGAKFPVYIMVTKIDLPAGMAKLLESLPEAARNLCVGTLIQSPEKRNLLPVDAQVTLALRELTDKIRRFCLYAGHPDGDSAPSPHRILAWEELRAMIPALRAYADEIFATNPYQETPLLRGIFFSSALRTQAENSRAFPSLSALIKNVFRVRESSGGMFLRDFFGRILPEDRRLHRPIAEYLRWRSSLRAVAYGVLLLTTFGLSALAGLSYQHNANLLESMASSVRAPADASMARRVIAYEQRYREEKRLAKEVYGSPLPSMGFTQAQKGFSAYVKALNEAFYRDVLSTALASLDEKRSRLTAASDDKEFFTLVSDIVWRYDLLDAASEGKSFEEMLEIPAMPQGILQALDLGDAPQLGPSIAYCVARSMYTIEDAEELAQYLRTARATLAQLPEIKSHSLQWIVHRAGTLSTLAPVRADSFWAGSHSSLLQDLTLEAVYTKEGLAVTLEYLDNLNLILNSDALKPSSAEFLSWYAVHYARAWQNFALLFAERISNMATLPVRGETVSFMSSDHNPCFALLIRMYDELQAVRRFLDPAPEWMDDLALFVRSLELVAKVNPENADPSLAGRLKSGVRDFYNALGQEMDADARERDMKAQNISKDVQAYLKALQALVPFTMNKDLAFNAVKDAMPNENNPNSIQAALTLATTTAYAMNAKINPNQSQDSPVYPLLTGPVSYFLDRLFNGASCQIQAMWEGEVLAKAGRLAPSQLQQGLFAEDSGLVRVFANNTLAFFLNRTLHGYAPENLAGRTVPFTKDFLTFLNAGMSTYKPTLDEYGVTIAALPADVNAGAIETPYAVDLVLQCAREKQQLVNYNSPASARFNWKQGACGDTFLSIKFKTASLDVVYAGENGFLTFLNDFQYGSKTFRAADFPEQSALLGKLGISDITLRYQLTGAEDILSSHRFAPGTLPFVATECKR